MEISSLIGKEILTPSGDKLGYVKDAYLNGDRKRLSCLICVDEEEEEFVLPARSLRAAEDVVIAARDIRSTVTGVPCPISCPVYTDKGELIGTVSDYIINSEEPVYIVVKDGVRTAYSASNIATGDTLILYPEGKPKRPPAQKKSVENGSSKQKRAQVRAKGVPLKETAQQNTLYSEAQNESALIENASHSEEKQPASLEEAPSATAQDTTAERAQGFGVDRCNLIGKLVKLSVYDGDGNAIALQGQRVTKEMISLARQNNLLLRLTVNTLTNLA